MPSLRERISNSSFNPNHDNYTDSLPRVERIVHPERVQIFDKAALTPVKKKRIRDVPTLGQILSAANGVNSRSAVVFRCVFDIAKTG